LILPYLGRDDIYQQYDFDEPWDGPNNRLLAANIPNCYRCPSQYPKAPFTTSYLAVVGPNSMWPSSAPRKGEEITDELSNTLWLVEGTEELDINWMEPRDLTVQELLETNAHNAPSSGNTVHEAGWQGAFADGHVVFIDSFISPETLRGLVTVNGGEDVSPPLARNRVRRVDWGPIVSAILFLLLALLPVVVVAKRRLRTRAESVKRHGLTHHGKTEDKEEQTDPGDEPPG